MSDDRGAFLDRLPGPVGGALRGGPGPVPSPLRGLHCSGGVLAGHLLGHATFAHALASAKL